MTWDFQFDRDFKKFHPKPASDHLAALVEKTHRYAMLNRIFKLDVWAAGFSDDGATCICLCFMRKKHNFNIYMDMCGRYKNAWSIDSAERHLPCTEDDLSFLQDVSEKYSLKLRHSTKKKQLIVCPKPVPYHETDKVIEVIDSFRMMFESIRPVITWHVW